MSCRLSKSGKAILVYDNDGYCYMTSVAYMKMLIEGKARNNMIALRKMGDKPTDHFNKNKIKDVSGDPMGHKAQKQRADSVVKVKGDW